MEAIAPEDVFDWHLIVCDVCGEDRYGLAHDQGSGLIVCEEHWYADGLLTAARAGVYVGPASEWQSCPVMNSPLPAVELLHVATAERRKVVFWVIPFGVFPVSN